MNSGDLLVKVDVRRELVNSIRLGRGVTVPDNLLALAPAQPLLLLFLLALLLVCLRAEDIHTRAREVLERGHDVRTALQLGGLRLACLQRVALRLPLRVEQLDTHVLLQLVHRDLLPTDGARSELLATLLSDCDKGGL